MAHHLLQNELCPLVVVAELRTAVRMGIGEYSVEALHAVTRFIGVENELNLTVDTADRRNYPQLVSYSYLSAVAVIDVDLPALNRL